jgi:DNA-binding transcriptional regulator YdaS (Cro superfamily)
LTGISDALNNAVMKLAEFFASERGAQSKLAAAAGIPAPMLSQWASGARPIPAERCPEIERATDGKVRCEDLRPDVAWDVLREQVASDDKTTVIVTPTYTGPDRRKSARL